MLNLNKNSSNKKIVTTALKQMLQSNAKYDIFQIQDLLFQGGFYRMNIPGVAFDQWEYKVPKRYQHKIKNTLNIIRK